MQSFRVISPIESILGSVCGFLATIGSGKPASAVINPVTEGEASGLSDQERRVSQGLMRVNHVGEVCAQALYQSQSLFAKSPEQKLWMHQSGAEEMRHLTWTRSRIDALGGRVSYLNPVWYLGAFTMGAIAGFLGDAKSLSFVLETERQVQAHLQSHLSMLPAGDLASIEVVEKMLADEKKHADAAQAAGAKPFPVPVQDLMRAASKVMTNTAYYI
jgi:3-demethoxyubiquinol 3-hydroxylase